MNIFNNIKVAGHIAAICTILVWGITFISTKILLAAFTPLEILLLRFGIGWVVLCLLCPRFSWPNNLRDEALFAAAGLSGVTLYFLLENVALTYTFATNVGVIVTAAPFFTALLAWLLHTGEKPAPGFFVGFLLSMAGILLVSHNGASFQLSPFGDILALMAAMAWAVYSLITRKLAVAGHGSLQTTRRIFFYGLIFMLPFVIHEGFHVEIGELVEPTNLLNMLFLGMGASAICFATWTFTLRALGAVAASMYIYLVPVVTIVTAAIILHEPLTFTAFAGICLVITGLVIAQKMGQSR